MSAALRVLDTVATTTLFHSLLGLELSAATHSCVRGTRTVQKKVRIYCVASGLLARVRSMDGEALAIISAAQKRRCSLSRVSLAGLARRAVES